MNYKCESWTMNHKFTVQATVRGYYIHQSIVMLPVMGNCWCLLNCERQLGNSHDPSTVAVKKEVQ